MQTLEEIAREIMSGERRRLGLSGSRVAFDALEADILSALIDVDADATERAAKVAEDDGGWHLPHRKWAEDYGPSVADRIASAIRNQKETTNACLILASPSDPP